MNFISDTKQRKLEAAHLPQAQSDNHLVLISPAEPVNEGRIAVAQHPLSSSNHNMTSCKDSVDTLFNEAHEQWRDVCNVYKTNATRSSPSVGNAGSGLLSAMNSSMW